MWSQTTKDDNIFMVSDFFSCKSPTNLNGTLEKLVVKTKIRSLNITFLDRFLSRMITRRTKSFFLHKKILQEQRYKYLLLLRFKLNVWKCPNFRKVNLPKNVVLKTNHHLYFDKNALKLFLETMTYYIVWMYIKFPEKKSRSWFSSHWFIRSFGNTVVKIFWRRPPYIISLQKTKGDKMFMIYNFF